MPNRNTAASAQPATGREQEGVGRRSIDLPDAVLDGHDRNGTAPNLSSPPSEAPANGRRQRQRAGLHRERQSTPSSGKATARPLATECQRSAPPATTVIRSGRPEAWIPIRTEGVEQTFVQHQEPRVSRRAKRSHENGEGSTTSVADPPDSKKLLRDGLRHARPRASGNDDQVTASRAARLRTAAATASQSMTLKNAAM